MIKQYIRLSWTKQKQHSIKFIARTVKYPSSLLKKAEFLMSQQSRMYQQKVNKSTKSFRRILNLILLLDPSEIGDVSNVVINNVEGALVASWLAPPAVGRCAINYDLHFVTDLGPVDLPSQEISFPIPNDIYCFTVEVEVTPRLGSTTGGSASSQEYTEGLCFVRMSNVVLF